jgi:hypothetical protein
VEVVKCCLATVRPSVQTPVLQKQTNNNNNKNPKEIPIQNFPISEMWSTNMMSQVII